MTHGAPHFLQCASVLLYLLLAMLQTIGNAAVQSEKTANNLPDGARMGGDCMQCFGWSSAIGLSQ